MNFEDYLSNLYISILLPNTYYNDIDIKNKIETNYKKIRLSITIISYDNLVKTNDIVNFKKNNLLPLIIDCNNIYFKYIINNLFDILKNNSYIDNFPFYIKYDNNINKLIYFIKYNEKYNQLINSFLIIFPLFNKLCEIISSKYLKYPILNINSNNDKLSLLFLKSRQLIDKDKYFYNCKYTKNDINIINKIYYDIIDKINFNDLFNKIN